MGDLPSNAFDGQKRCPGGRIQIATAQASPAQVELVIKAAKADDDPKKRKSECNLRLVKQRPNPANPGLPLVTPVAGDIGKGLGMAKSVSLAANEQLFLVCTKAREGQALEDNVVESVAGGEAFEDIIEEFLATCRFTVTISSIR